MATILVVDDAAEIRDVMTELLVDEGFEVSTATRAEDALSHLRSFMPDLLILDGRLPGMSGWHCLNVLRAGARTARLPVLMLTAALDDLERVARPPDPCTTCLAKPFELDELLTAIHGVLETCNKQLVPV